MSHRTSIALALGAALPFLAAPAEAGCLTNQAGCSGKATFLNTSSFTRCVSLTRGSQAVNRFCLRSGEAAEIDVRTGDQACWSNGNRLPPRNCQRRWIQVD